MPKFGNTVNMAGIRLLARLDVLLAPTTRFGLSSITNSPQYLEKHRSSYGSARLPKRSD